MTTQTEATRTAIAHRAAMRATARAQKALIKARTAAHHPRATSADWIHLDACKLEKIHAEAQQEQARAEAERARLAHEATQPQ
ncbi:MAG: hypothetical protein KA170_03705 [Candidatus Promineofilum sp.]|nr:hypothetical protein [Promineifilum sp.]